MDPLVPHPAQPDLAVYILDSSMRCHACHTLGTCGHVQQFISVIPCAKCGKGSAGIDCYGRGFCRAHIDEVVKAIPEWWPT